MHEIDLHFGNDVLLSDGKAGKLCGVAVNTENNQITHLLVEDGFLLKKTRAFPFPIAAPAGADIALAVAAGAVEDYPIYREETIAVPAEGGGTAWTGSGQQVATAPPTTYQKVRYGVPDGRAVLKRGATITAADGRAGKLEGVLAAAQGGAVTGLVVQHGAIILSRHLVPAELVETISQSGIFLHVSGEEVANLPPYPLRETQEHEGEPMATHINDPARPGENLITAVSRALSEDDRTGDSVIEVVDEQGIITLYGTVPNAAARAAAAEIAAAQPGVISVTNSLRVG